MMTFADMRWSEVPGYLFKRKRVSHSRALDPFSNTTDALKLLSVMNEGNADVNPYAAKGIPAIFYCINLITDMISSCPKSIRKRLPKGSELATDHYLQYIISSRPSERMTAIQHEKIAVAWMYIYGNSYERVHRHSATGKVTGIELWHPGNVEVKEVEAVIDGVMHKEVMYKNHRTGDAVTHHDMIHIMDEVENMEDLKAVSRFMVCGKPISTDLRRRGMVDNMYKFGLFLAGWIKWPGRLDSKDALKLSDRIKKWYGGVKNAGKVLALEQGADFHQLTLPFKDWQFAELSDISLQEAALIMGLKPGHLGNKDSESYNTLEQYSKELWQSPVNPVIIKRQQEYNHKIFFPKKRGKLYVHYDSTYVLMATAKERGELYRAMIGSITVNEIREREGFNPIEGGDQPLVQLGFTTLDHTVAGTNLKGEEGKPKSKLKLKADEKELSQN